MSVDKYIQLCDNHHSQDFCHSKKLPLLLCSLFYILPLAPRSCCFLLLQFCLLQNLYKCNQTVFVICVSLLLLKTFFKFIHVLCVSIECSFLLPSGTSLCHGSSTVCLSDHQLGNIWVVFFQFLAVMSKADMNFACTSNFIFLNIAKYQLFWLLLVFIYNMHFYEIFI